MRELKASKREPQIDSVSRLIGGKWVMFSALKGG